MVERTQAEHRSTLVALMMDLQRHMRHRLGPETANAWLQVDLSLTQMKVLFCLLAAGEQPMNQLARALGIGMPAATNLVDRLVEHGYVRRDHNPLDRRVVLVRATEKAERLVERVRQIHQDQVERVIRYVPEEDLQALIAAARVFIEAAKRAAAEEAESVSSVGSPS